MLKYKYLLFMPLFLVSCTTKHAPIQFTAPKIALIETVQLRSQLFLKPSEWTLLRARFADPAYLSECQRILTESPDPSLRASAVRFLRYALGFKNNPLQSTIEKTLAQDIAGKGAASLADRVELLTLLKEQNSSVAKQVRADSEVVKATETYLQSHTGKSI